MLGHVRPRICRLSALARTEYRRAYCSLCAALRGRFGLPAGLLVNNELALALVVLSDSGPSGSATATTPCPANAFLTRRRILGDRAGAFEVAGFAVGFAWFQALDRQTELVPLADHLLDPPDDLRRGTVNPIYGDVASRAAFIA